jgi:hypothetical protein
VSAKLATHIQQVTPKSSLQATQENTWHTPVKEENPLHGQPLSPDPVDSVMSPSHPNPQAEPPRRHVMIMQPSGIEHAGAEGQEQLRSRRPQFRQLLGTNRSEQQDGQKLPGLKHRRLSVLSRGTDEELLEEVAQRLLERLGVATTVLKQKPAEEIDDLHEVSC